MAKNLKELFYKIKTEPPRDLPFVIWQKIVKRNKKIFILKVGIFSFVGLSSLFGTFFAFSNLTNNISNSGIYEYTSLLFSKNSGVTLYWRELAFSIAESMPVVEIIYVLSLIFILFISIRYIAKQINNNQLVLSI